REEDLVRIADRDLVAGDLEDLFRARHPDTIAGWFEPEPPSISGSDVPGSRVRRSLPGGWLRGRGRRRRGRRRRRGGRARRWRGARRGGGGGGGGGGARRGGGGGGAVACGRRRARGGGPAFGSPPLPNACQPMMAARTPAMIVRIGTYRMWSVVIRTTLSASS